jgi:signal transduction histidine kinase
VERRSDLGALFRSDRPPLELDEYRRTYRRTRVAANLILIIASTLLRGHFEHAHLVVGGIVALSSSILLHALVRKDASLLEMLTLDTVLYIVMTVVADTAEVALFVGMAQSFMLFQFVPARVAVAATVGFMSLSTAATTISVTMEIQSRSPADTLLLITVVTWLTTIPAIWMQLRAGAESHRRREQREQLARDKDELLRDRDRFVASVSHELRTPLTTVVGLAHTLADPGSKLTDAEKVEFMATLVEESEEVAAIVDDLLVAARAETGHLSLTTEEVDFATELETVAPDIPITSDPGRSTVLGDPVRVRQILRNLISNARRYGGPNVKIRIEERGALGTVTVLDDGDALPEELLAVIFAAYGRAHERPGRTDSVGLGLTVSRQLARLMGGDVSYHHRDGWAHFALKLPRSIPETADATGHPEDGSVSECAERAAPAA